MENQNKNIENINCLLDVEMKNNENEEISFDYDTLIKKFKIQICNENKELWEPSFKKSAKYIIWYPHLNETEIFKKQGNFFKSKNPKVQIKSKHWFPKNENNVIAVTDIFDFNVEKMNLLHIYKYKWIKFCFNRNEFILKNDMNQVEEEKYRL